MVTSSATATSTDKDYSYSILQYIEHKRPVSVGQRFRTGRFVDAPRGHWGGSDFVIFDQPRWQRIQNAVVDETCLRTKGTRSQHRSTLPIYSEPASRPWTSETKEIFSGAIDLPPCEIPSKAPSMHISHIRLGRDSTFNSTTSNSVEFPRKEVTPPSVILGRGERNREKMLNGLHVSDRLKFMGDQDKRVHYKSQYSDVHNRLGSIIFDFSGSNKKKLDANNCHFHAERPSQWSSNFKRISGNRILSHIRDQNPRTSIIS